MNYLKLLRQPKIGGVLTASVCLLALIVWSLTSADADADFVTTQRYYYDPVNKEVFVNGVFPDVVAPIPAPDGSEGYVAYIYSCGACEESEWWISHAHDLSRGPGAGGHRLTDRSC